MSSIRLGVVKTLTTQDIYYSLRSTRGLLFLVFFCVYWFWMFWKLSDGYAQYLTNQEASFLLSFIIDPKVVQSLFVGRSPTLSTFYYIAVTTVPMFVLLAASDQTANDIGSKYLRFLTPRCNRIEIFIARFIGAVILVCSAYLIISGIAMLVAMMVDKNSFSLILADTPLVILSLFVYVIPFIALMSLCSVIVGSAGLSALVGISVYITILVVIAVVGIKLPSAADMLAYLLPNSPKLSLLELKWSGLIQSLFVMPIYVFAYGALGWMIFSKRDI